MKHLALKMIRKYQATGGSKRWFGIECNFTPTCSAYTYDAIEKYGFFQGVSLGIRRIKSCSQKDSICKCVDPLL